MGKDVETGGRSATMCGGRSEDTCAAPAVGAAAPTAAPTDARRKLKVRLNRIAGQVAGIQRMVDEDKYCVDVLTQIAAVRSALDAVGVELLTGHIESCVIGHGTGSEHHCAQPMSKEELVAEVQTTLARFLK